MPSPVRISGAEFLAGIIRDYNRLQKQAFQRKRQSTNLPSQLPPNRFQHPATCFLLNKQASAITLLQELERTDPSNSNTSAQPKTDYNQLPPTISAMDFSRNQEISAIAFVNRMQQTPLPEICLDTEESLPPPITQEAAIKTPKAA